MNPSCIKHPASLPVFFATEMWERYGFYVVQSLLALYLALHFHWEDKAVYALTGSFTALTYLSPVVGGLIADHLLGQKRTVLVGLVCLFFSYLTLFLMANSVFLIPSLAGIAVGTGLLKPSISSLLGNQYADDSLQREKGFTIFYMGLTLGIILGTTIPSELTRHFNWPTAFFSAALGMVLAYGVFFWGMRFYRIADYDPKPLTPHKIVLSLAAMAVLWGVAYAMMVYPSLADCSFLLVAGLSVYYITHTLRREPPRQARNTLIIGLLCVISVLFWAFYFQMFLSLTLFLLRVVQANFLGIAFPPPYFVAVQSAGMIVFGLMLAREKTPATALLRGRRVSTKFLCAMLLMCLAYGIITLTCFLNPGEIYLSALYFIPAYLCISLAELLLSPVGLSMVTLLACRKKVSTMMGIFFVSLGLGAFLAGKLALLTAVPEGHLSVTQLKALYLIGFGKLFLILLSVTLLCLILRHVIRHLLSLNDTVLSQETG